MNPSASLARSNQFNRTTTPTPTGTNTDSIVQIKSVTVNNKTVKILATTDSSSTSNGKQLKSGLPLYFLEGQKASQPDCGNTGTPVCNEDWPPLLSPSTKTPSAPAGITLTVGKNVNGQQVKFNGHLLYTYSDDAKLGGINGTKDTLNGHKWKLAIVK